MQDELEQVCTTSHKQWYETTSFLYKILHQDFNSTYRRGR